MRRLAKAMGVLLGVLLTVAAAVLIVFSVWEYRPEEIEELEIKGQGQGSPVIGKAFTVMTYNIGYGCNDAGSDFFMDGGTKVMPESKEEVYRNIDGIIETVKRLDADIVFLQEADQPSKRSYEIDQVKLLQEGIPEYSSAYSRNFYAKYVPYPIPHTIGKVDSGLVTLNSFETKSAKRYNLPTPFKWPLRTCQLKRGLLVERIPIQGTAKELVIINLHLEAYDDGEGKKAQTKVLTELLLSEYEKGNYCLAGGDFNQYLPQADNSKYPIVEEGNYTPEMVEEDFLASGWSWALDDSVPTCRLLNMPYEEGNPLNQFYVIDAFILSPNIILKQVETVDEQFKWTDHNPVKIEVILKEE